MTLDSVQPIFTQRFLIHLRYVEDTDGATSDSSHSSEFTEPNFRRPSVAGVVGNLGESLELCNEGGAQDSEDGVDADMFNDEESRAGSDSSTERYHSM